MNNGFIESRISIPTPLVTNSSMIAFQNDTRTRSTCGCDGWLCHREGSPNYKIVKGGNYKVNFSATLFTQTGGVVAVGLYEDGVLLPDTIRTELIDAGGLVSVSFDKMIKVCCKANSNISVGSVPQVINPESGIITATAVPTIYSGNFSITN